MIFLEQGFSYIYVCFQLCILNIQLYQSTKIKILYFEFGPIGIWNNLKIDLKKIHLWTSVFIHSLCKQVWWWMPQKNLFFRAVLLKIILFIEFCNLCILHISTQGKFELKNRIKFMLTLLFMGWVRNLPPPCRTFFTNTQNTCNMSLKLYLF